MNDSGREQARALILPLRRLGIEALLCSDLSRARESAEIIGTSLSLPVHSDPRLREIHLGSAQGLNREEIALRFGAELSSRLRTSPLSDADVLELGCESGQSVLERGISAIAEFLLAHPRLERVAVCSHGGVLRRLLQKATGDGGFPPPVPNAVLFGIELERDEIRPLTSLPLIRP